MYITSKNFTEVLKTDIKNIFIRGSSKEGFLIVFELKKNSIFNFVLSEIPGELLDFESAEKAAFYLIEICGYQDSVTVSDRSAGIYETRKIDSFLSA